MRPYLLTLNLLCFIFSFSASSQVKSPNVIIILADDLGYGDLSCYGHPTIMTPNLDKMAAEGMKFTQFYSAANVCTPSRAALLTGRLPVRNGMAGSETSGNVLYPTSAGGLPTSEITIAKALNSKGYRTGIIGKWHLGHLPEYLPANHGFDYYFGIPYSNDMGDLNNKNYPPLPLYKAHKVIEHNPDQRLLTKRYTEEVIEFLKNDSKEPFFLYYTNNAPHVPLYASDSFKGKSKRGLYGDVVEELDWSVGKILSALKDLKLDKNTLVIFTSDNGPWLREKEEGGSAGPLFEGKGASYEGGMRVPAIAWWPGVIKINQVNTAMVSNMDLFPTILNLAKVDLPANKVLDSYDIFPLLTGEKKQVRDVIYYYNRHVLYAIRKGVWKAHFMTRPSYNPVPPVTHSTPLLYNIETDPGEKYDLSSKHPEIIEEMRKEYENHTTKMIAEPTHLEARIKKK